MSVNEVIKTALDSFSDPVVFGEYASEGATPPNRYYTFNYSSLGTDWADNAPGHERYLIQAHFFCAAAYRSVERVQATKQALFAAGLTWPDVVNASDETGQHWVFECEYTDVAETGNGKNGQINSTGF